MNRTLTNVLFGGIAVTPQSDVKIEGQITKTSVDETVESLSNADSVILVRLKAFPQPVSKRLVPLESHLPRRVQSTLQ